MLIFILFFSNNDILGREILNLEKKFICQNEIFKINYLFNKHVLKFPRYHGNQF